MCHSVYLVASRNLRPFAGQVCQQALEQGLTSALQSHKCEVRRARPILTANRHGFIESRALMPRMRAHCFGVHSLVGILYLDDINRKYARQSGSNRAFARSSMISETSPVCSTVLPSSRVARRELQPSAEPHQSQRRVFMVWK